MNNTQELDASAAVIRIKSDHRPNRNQPFRLFTCKTCYHKLRFGASRCGQCWQRAPMCNQRRVYLRLAVALLAAGLWVVLAFARA